MNKKIVWPLLVIIIGGAAAYLLATSKPVPQPQAVPEEPAPVVEVVDMTPAPRTVEVHSYGTIRPHRQIDLTAEVGGRIVGVADNFEEGAVFAAGQVLLQIDPRNYEVAVQRARAQLADAEQKLATERGKARQAQREWRELGSAEANALYLREPQLKAAEALVEAAQADVDQAEADLERTAIQVPFAGRIRDVSANLGQFISPGSKLATVFSTQRLEVVLPLTTRDQQMLDLARLHRGEAIDVRLWSEDGGQRLEWPAQVRRAQAAIDEKTRVLSVIAELAVDTTVDNVGRGVPPYVGQFVQAELRGRSYAYTLEIPVELLRSENTLWTVDAQKQLQLRAVKVLREAQGKVLLQVDDDGPLSIVRSYLANPAAGRLLNLQQTSPQAEISR